MNIKYKINEPITADQFIEVLNHSTLGQRRPVDDRECMEGMLSNSNLTISAWDDGRLVGIARSMTDFYFACYLSDLAVSQTYQKSGIGKKMLSITQDQLGPRCTLILLAAPAANLYYGKIGFINNPRCWVLERNTDVEILRVQE